MQIFVHFVGLSGDDKVKKLFTIQANRTVTSSSSPALRECLCCVCVWECVCWCVRVCVGMSSMLYVCILSTKFYSNLILTLSDRLPECFCLCPYLCVRVCVRVCPVSFVLVCAALSLSLCVGIYICDISDCKLLRYLRQLLQCASMCFASAWTRVQLPDSLLAPLFLHPPLRFFCFLLLAFFALTLCHKKQQATKKHLPPSDAAFEFV